jgi:SAM-dependent methyltransferase
MWEAAERSGLSKEQCIARQDRELASCAAIWQSALLLPDQHDLVQSTLIEIGRWRAIDDLATIRIRCEEALRVLKLDWEHTVHSGNAAEVERYYNAADRCIEELMWWHTLLDDNSPLAYVAALEFAQAVGCRSYLDFGSGVGSGALLFASCGIDTSLADISDVLLAFCRNRFEQRGREAMFYDLKSSSLPTATFDFITAMDVFEHLADPVRTVDQLCRSLKPGGFVYGRFSSEDDTDRPQHIVQDFRPVFDRFHQMGFEEVFRDDWLWGHQMFQKAA